MIPLLCQPHHDYLIRLVFGGPAAATAVLRARRRDSHHRRDGSNAIGPGARRGPRPAGGRELV